MGGGYGGGQSPFLGGIQVRPRPDWCLCLALNFSNRVAYYLCLYISVSLSRSPYLTFSFYISIYVFYMSICISLCSASFFLYRPHCPPKQVSPLISPATPSYNMSSSPGFHHHAAKGSVTVTTPRYSGMHAVGCAVKHWPPNKLQIFSKLSSINATHMQSQS